MSINISLKDELQKIDEEYGDQMYKMFGPTLLGFPEDVDSSRLYMFTSHVKQVLTLLNPDVPRIQTGFENVIGQYNKAFKKLEGRWEVVDKIRKFRNGDIYTIVLYNKADGVYDMIEKIVAEDLTEKFGYVYNTDFMDSLKVGDTVTDQILYKSTSYDENMNYRYGKNAKVIYSTSNDTLEDAFVIRKSWADGVKSVEVDTVQVMINDNDIPLNLYGDNEKEYKIFPDIGRHVNNSVICATRRINKNHILVDFQSQNMREIHSTDVEYYVSKDSEIYDMDIYYNGDGDFPSSIFFSQLKEYYDDICAYADRVFDWATDIKSSGKKYTAGVSDLRARYKNFNNTKYKWKNKDKVFSNIVIEFKVKSVMSLDLGSKLSGRYGNKGVVSRIADDTKLNLAESVLSGCGQEATAEEIEHLASKLTIVDDEKMPYTDKYPVDILLNMSGSTRRLNPGQIVETDLSFIANELQDHIKTLKTIQEKEDVIFKFLSMVNEDEYNFFYNMYESFDSTIQIKGRNIRLMNQTAKENFIKDIEENGFYLVKPPHANIRYEAIKKIYEEFNFIKPHAMYINIFGTKKRRIILDGVVGDMYIIVLKQNTSKNFSSRSTFRVNRSNLPAKDITKRTNRSSYAKTPIKLSEIYNLFNSISGRTLAEYNVFMRSSTLGRKSLSRILEADGNPLAIKKLKVKDSFLNTNADILNAHLKTIGTKLQFSVDKDITPDVIEDVIMPMNFGKYTIYDSPLKKILYSKLFNEFNKYLRSVRIVESYRGEKEDIAWNYVFNLDSIKELGIDKDVKDMLLASTKGNIRTSSKNTKDEVMDDTELDIDDINDDEEFD